mmetsp:Transcript_12300/g.29302  ORF Transcript_12300/g.29302 Transcript_12300/m.29302 type:complete len:93 (-) Transcript_12300:241-519(-)
MDAFFAVFFASKCRMHTDQRNWLGTHNKKEMKGVKVPPAHQALGLLKLIMIDGKRLGTVFLTSRAAQLQRFFYAIFRHTERLDRQNQSSSCR